MRAVSHSATRQGKFPADASVVSDAVQYEPIRLSKDPSGFHHREAVCPAHAGAATPSCPEHVHVSCRERAVLAAPPMRAARRPVASHVGHRMLISCDKQCFQFNVTLSSHESGRNAPAIKAQACIYTHHHTTLGRPPLSDNILTLPFTTP